MTTPIGTIRNKIDSDLTKYHSTSLCRIVNDKNIKNIRGVGLCAMVSPVNKYNENDPLTVGVENTFPVLIINRAAKWFESNISDKYYVLTLNVVEDRAPVTVGFLVSKTIVTDMEIFRNSIGDEGAVKDKSGVSLETIQEENIHDPKTG